MVIGHHGVRAAQRAGNKQTVVIGLALHRLLSHEVINMEDLGSEPGQSPVLIKEKGIKLELNFTFRLTLLVNTLEDFSHAVRQMAVGAYGNIFEMIFESHVIEIDFLKWGLGVSLLLGSSAGLKLKMSWK